MEKQYKTKIHEMLDNWRTNLGYLVGLIVVIPSVIDSINDVWVSWNDLPIGQKEKINSRLFKKHWRESPVHSKQLIIEVKGKKIPITLDIYGNGNILVDFGRNTQWFPFESMNLSESGYFISNANAEVFDKVDQQIKKIPQGAITVINTEINEKKVVRDKVFSDGSIERQVIDMNTGEINSTESIESPAIKNNQDIIEKRKIEVIKLPDQIDAVDVKEKPIIKHLEKKPDLEKTEIE